VPSQVSGISTQHAVSAPQRWNRRASEVTVVGRGLSESKSPTHIRPVDILDQMFA